MLEARILEFIQAPVEAEFNRLALDSFRWQCERNPKLRALCVNRGREPEALRDWSEIPLVPTRSYKTTDLRTSEPQAVFRSSGTTQPQRSVHPHSHLDLYQTVIDATFPAACLTTTPPVDMLSLIPTRESMPESSLSYMIDHVVSRFGSAASLTAVGPHGLDITAARSWIGAAQRHGRPVVLLATGLALKQLLDGLRRRTLRFRLPAGSCLFETGGTKGRHDSIPRADLLSAIHEHLGLSADHVVREYGMTELTSHFYTDVLHGGDPDRFLPPRWTRVRTLDPMSLQPLTAGETGLLAVFDLANLSSAVHVLTEDLGRLDGAGFRLVGRADGAELRGCSLMAEELAGRPDERGI